MSQQTNNIKSYAGWNFDNSYVGLPESLYSHIHPTLVSAPSMVIFNHQLATELGLTNEILKSEQGTAMLAGNIIPENADPIAMAYAGHQFGHFTILGDGRAILLGEHITPDGKRFDVQLKGSGKTPYSRRGDGRAALGPMLREYIISEAMYALGIPTTRSLAVVATGETVYREKPLKGAILTRIASSHLRVGTFEFVSVQDDAQLIKTLADYSIARHYPECAEMDQRYQVFLQAVMDRQAALMAKSMLVGFIHGVMNTDNMSISGEMLDYGPCAFMDSYDPETVFSSIDHLGRYAYGNQPHIAKWNIEQFAKTIWPLLHNEPEEAKRISERITSQFTKLFEHYWVEGMRQKLGLFAPHKDDSVLISSLLNIMYKEKADFTSGFRILANVLEGDVIPQAFKEWIGTWKKRLDAESRPYAEVIDHMRAHNPIYIPRNHLVEEALVAAQEQNDFSKVKNLLAVLSKPFDEQQEYSEYSQPPATKNLNYRTFCGT
jgi:uncharacterized protein YdiU (UPF0061 family)